VNPRGMAFRARGMDAVDAIASRFGVVRGFE
jgi:hypothetical protein